MSETTESMKWFKLIISALAILAIFITIWVGLNVWSEHRYLDKGMVLVPYKSAHWEQLP